MEDICRLIDRYEIPHRYIHMEVTESAYTENPEQVIRKVTGLRKAGFQIEMDDFGTGYSNYGYMRDRTFDIVKVDRSFVTDIDKLKDNYLMVSFIIKMAHEMGLHVCIEGVETKEELSCVKRLGADYIQGYYYGKPVCLQDFEEQHLKRFVLG